jgi:hypothetical protein
MSYEYRVIPAPVKGTKAKGVKTTQDRFALSLQETMNAMAADGWEFQRAETLPSEERSGLTGTKTVYHNVLVFRRAREAELAAFRPRLLEAPTDAAPEPTPVFRPVLSAHAAPSDKAPAVPSPRALSGSLARSDDETPEPKA